ncbi:MAG: potassium channel family protein [Alphaproteobacteria bacterium]|nr:potassium channel family protein [Alphaproteobacteria bacterium]
MASHDDTNAPTTTWQTHLRGLYHGHEPSSRNFRYAILAFDAFTILFFIVTSAFETETWVLFADALIAVVIALDVGVRWWIAYDRRRFLMHFATWADIVVIVSLLAPLFLGNFLFLRVLRALRLLRSYRVLADLRQEFGFFRRNEEVFQSAINLLVFVFIMTAVVYVSQHTTNPGISNYIDALYFTVTALTTTGFGDITLHGTGGRLLSVMILLLGVALFLRLIQSVVRPVRTIYECPDCGLTRHDADAVHCKHCGRVLHITTTGED